MSGTGAGRKGGGGIGGGYLQTESLYCRKKITQHWIFEDMFLNSNLTKGPMFIPM